MAAQNNGNAGPSLESSLWAAADRLRSSMDAAEYKHVVLGLVFLRYISDAFGALHAALEAQAADGADPEDPDEYAAKRVFWVPPEARWAPLQDAAHTPGIGRGWGWVRRWGGRLCPPVSAPSPF